MRKNMQAWLLLAAAGACAGTASAQIGGVVNISGASLLQSFVQAQASTNDFIDVDGDGISGYLGTFINNFPDQLAVGGPLGLDNAGVLEDQELVVQYRVTGSVNGLIELVRFGRPVFVTSDANTTDFLTGIPGAAQAQGGTNPGFASTAFHNRAQYIGLAAPIAGVRTGNYNQGNPGGAPNRSDTTTYLATYAAPDTSATGGVQIDVAPIDVSTFLGVQKPGTPSWNASASTAGYGTNPLEMVTKTGTTPSGSVLLRTNKLAELGNRNLNLTSPDANTIFDSALLYAPICPITNFGTGITQLSMTQLQHLFGTGRMATGENLVAITRDSGSGTRNAFNNCIGQDPSFGRGENIGPLSNSGTQNNLGTAHIPGNKGSGGNMLATIRNVMLGIGYAGPETGVSGSGSSSWLVRDGSGNSALEIVSVQNDVYGGTAFSRPTLSNLIHNNAQTWLIGGQAVLATLGDPRANGAASGGTGWIGAFDPFVDGSNGFPADSVYQIGENFTDLNGNGLRDATNAEAGLTNSNPAMANDYAARYMNNIFRSIAAFNSVPTDVDNFGMPGEFAAARFLSLAALDNLHSETNYLVLAPNAGRNPAVQSYVSGLTSSPYNSALISGNNFANATGKAPTRNTGTVYSDGVANGNTYISQAGTTISYGSNLNVRNKIAGDFNGNGARDLGDATDMIAAWNDRNDGNNTRDWATGTAACVEILGDFNGDGSFTKADVRYWADGLALVNGQLDRAAGFAAVDNAFGGNFFSTTKVNALAGWTNGDGRGDVANASGLTAPGWAPIGADRNNGAADADDNKIDVSDVNYVLKQFNNAFVTDGAANWSNLAEAVGFDLSADMNGDLVVNQADVTVLVSSILATKYGDLNLDGTVDCTEKNTLILGLGATTTGGWAAGDLDGNGTIDAADVALLFGADGVCLGDYDCSGGVDGDDVIAFFGDWDNGAPAADLDASGGVDGDDVIIFFARWDAGC
ncbi:MAG: hypothetical protein ACOYN0_04405 [Phycisphaerales bacterium]